MFISPQRSLSSIKSYFVAPSISNKYLLEALNATSLERKYYLRSKFALNSYNVFSNILTKSNKSTSMGLCYVCFGHRLLSPITMLHNSFGTSTCVYTIGSLFWSVAFMPSVLLTQGGCNIIINSSLSLFDNDDYDANNHHYWFRPDKKDDNNNATTTSKDKIKSIDSIEEMHNYLECHSWSTPKALCLIGIIIMIQWMIQYDIPTQFDK